MRWAEQQRIEWIGNRIRQRKRINRRDIIEKFGVSLPQASTDLRKFISLNPGTVTYDTRQKCYRVSKVLAP